MAPTGEPPAGPAQPPGEPPAAPARPAEVAAALRETFESGRTRSPAWRQAQLRSLARGLRVAGSDLLDALATDLRRPTVEAWTTDLAPPAAEAAYLARHLEEWSWPARVRVPLHLQPGRAWVQPEPRGVVLVLAPWNYPVQLTLQPLAAALAAGNTVALKPSELAPATAAALASFVERHLDPQAVRVVLGGPEVAASLLSERWDHIFFTGSGTTAQKVLRAAAEQLTSVTLELGGKSPAIVTSSADVASAARRVAWGKFLNAGQTCVAPDYVAVQRDVAEAFCRALSQSITDFYGADPRNSPDFGRIINDRHLHRLAALLAQRGQARIVAGGQIVEAERYVAPTVLDGVGWDDPIMADEIFGPILPVLTFDDLDDLVATLNRRPEPVAAYVFTGEPAGGRRLLRRIRSGGGAINATVLQVAVPELPFGGIGPSGMGTYHGKSGFDTFSHHRAVYERRGNIDPPILYPPYRRLKGWALRRLAWPR